MSDLSKFEAFTSVVQNGSITAAASKLGISKPALSKQIKALEQRYKVNLFKLHKQRLQLTPQGERLYEQCLRLQTELENTRNLCNLAAGKPAGCLHVVAFSYFANKLIFPKLKAFLHILP